MDKRAEQALGLKKLLDAKNRIRSCFLFKHSYNLEGSLTGGNMIKILKSELRALIVKEVRAMFREQQEETSWDKQDLYHALKYLYSMVYRRGEDYKYSLDHVSDMHDIPKDVLAKELEDFDGTYAY